jgi:hypothetical protein
MQMTKTASIGIRVDPAVKEAAERAASEDHRTLASLVEKLLVEHLRSKGYLPSQGLPRVKAAPKTLKVNTGGRTLITPRRR